MQAASALLSGAKSAPLVNMLAADLLPSLAPMLKPASTGEAASKPFEDAVDIMFSNAANLVQSRLPTETTSMAPLASKLESLLSASLSHPRRGLRTRAQQLWQATFASALEQADIPASVSAVLRRTLMASSESSESSSNSMEFKAEAESPSKKVFGSFLQRTSVSTPPKPKPPTTLTSSPANKPSPFKNFKRPPTSSSKRISLEDESSQVGTIWNPNVNEN